MPKKAATQILEVFEVGFADCAQQQAFEAGQALAIVDAHLGQQPVRFAAAASAAIADGGGAVGLVAKAGGGAGGELPGLQRDAGTDESIRSGPGGQPALRAMAMYSSVVIFVES